MIYDVFRMKESINVTVQSKVWDIVKCKYNLSELWKWLVLKYRNERRGRGKERSEGRNAIRIDSRNKTKRNQVIEFDRN